MKTNYLLIIFCLLTNLLFAQSKGTIDLRNSVITWTGHAEVGTYAPQGTLGFKEGKLSMNRGSVTNADLTIDMKSMKQTNEHLLEHLQGNDFFDVEKYPTSIIKINRISHGVAYGQLRIKDKASAFRCPVRVSRAGGQTTITGNTVVDRTKFGIIYNSGNFFSGLGDRAIRNTFDIEFYIVAVDK